MTNLSNDLSNFIDKTFPSQEKWSLASLSDKIKRRQNYLWIKLSNQEKQVQHIERVLKVFSPDNLTYKELPNSLTRNIYEWIKEISISSPNLDKTEKILKIILKELELLTYKEIETNYLRNPKAYIQHLKNNNIDKKLTWLIDSNISKLDKINFEIKKIEEEDSTTNKNSVLKKLELNKKYINKTILSLLKDMSKSSTSSTWELKVNIEATSTIVKNFSTVIESSFKNIKEVLAEYRSNKTSIEDDVKIDLLVERIKNEKIAWSIEKASEISEKWDEIKKSNWYTDPSNKEIIKKIEPILDTLQSQHTESQNYNPDEKLLFPKLDSEINNLADDISKDTSYPKIVKINGIETTVTKEATLTLLFNIKKNIKDTLQGFFGDMMKWCKDILSWIGSLIALPLDLIGFWNYENSLWHNPLLADDNKFDLEWKWWIRHLFDFAWDKYDEWHELLWALIWGTATIASIALIFAIVWTTESILRKIYVKGLLKWRYLWDYWTMEDFGKHTRWLLNPELEADRVEMNQRDEVINKLNQRIEDLENSNLKDKLKAEVLALDDIRHTKSSEFFYRWMDIMDKIDGNHWIAKRAFRKFMRESFSLPSLKFWDKRTLYNIRLLKWFDLEVNVEKWASFVFDKISTDTGDDGIEKIIVWDSPHSKNIENLIDYIYTNNTISHREKEIRVKRIEDFVKDMRKNPKKRLHYIQTELYKIAEHNLLKPEDAVKKIEEKFYKWKAPNWINNIKNIQILKSLYKTMNLNLSGVEIEKFKLLKIAKKWSEFSNNQLEEIFKKIEAEETIDYKYYKNKNSVTNENIKKMFIDDDTGEYRSKIESIKAKREEFIKKSFDINNKSIEIKWTSELWALKNYIDLIIPHNEEWKYRNIFTQYKELLLKEKSPINPDDISDELFKLSKWIIPKVVAEKILLEDTEIKNPSFKHHELFQQLHQEIISWKKDITIYELTQAIRDVKNWTNFNFNDAVEVDINEKSDFLKKAKLLHQNIMTKEEINKAMATHMSDAKKIIAFNKISSNPFSDKHTIKNELDLFIDDLKNNTYTKWEYSKIVSLIIRWTSFENSLLDVNDWNNFRDDNSLYSDRWSDDHSKLNKDFNTFVEEKYKNINDLSNTNKKLKELINLKNILIEADFDEKNQTFLEINNKIKILESNVDKDIKQRIQTFEKMDTDIDKKIDDIDFLNAINLDENWADISEIKQKLLNRKINLDLKIWNTSKIYHKNLTSISNKIIKLNEEYDLALEKQFDDILKTVDVDEIDYSDSEIKSSWKRKPLRAVRRNNLKELMNSLKNLSINR